MTHPYLTMLLARGKLEELDREAAKARQASEARVATHARVLVGGALADGSVTLRPCRAEDRVPRARPAALGGGESPPGSILVAKVGGELRAALALKDGAVAANPHDPTAALPALLRGVLTSALRATASTTGETHDLFEQSSVTS